MTKKELYTCDICRTDYANKKDAMKCEKSHVKVKEIDSCRYLNASQNGKCPQSIIVKMEDGIGVAYKR